MPHIVTIPIQTKPNICQKYGCYFPSSSLSPYVCLILKKNILITRMLNHLELEVIK